MQYKFKFSISMAGVAITLVSSAAAVDAGSPGEAAIAAEAARHRDAVAKLPEAIMGVDERRATDQQLATLDDLLKADRAHAALHTLLRITRYLDAQAFRVAKAAEIKEGLPALERDWAASGEERTRQAESYAGARGPAASAIARALSETAFYESRIVHEACLVYGRQVGADAGYFYLGEARALMGFALFARQLGANGGPTAPRLRPLGARLGELEQELLDAYAANTASPQASAFARANGALKLARELDRDRSEWGALYQYLLAEQALGQARATEASPDAVALRRAADERARRLSAGKTDHTLGLAFVQVAQNSLARLGAAPDPKQALMNARVLVERVLPAYLRIAGE